MTDDYNRQDFRKDIYRVPPFLRQTQAVSGIMMYMLGTGANIALPGVLLEQLRAPGSTFHLTPEHESWIASMLGLALISGIIIAPLSLQKLGRKVTNQLSTLPSLAGWGMIVAANGPEMLLASRFLQGFSMGLQAACCSISIAEYCSPKLRGAFLGTIALAFSSGILLAHLFGTLLSWRTAAMACSSFYLLSLILITLSPETPPYLAYRGRFIQCRKAHHWLRGYDVESEKELSVLLNSQRNTCNQPKEPISFLMLKNTAIKPEFYKPTLIMVLMFILFQASGFTVLPSYTVFLMKRITDDSVDGYTGMMIVDAVRFITSVLTCFMLNKYNRRTVLFLGIVITALSLLLTSILLYLRNWKYIPDDYKWTPIIPALAYVFGQTLGILPVPWSVAGEVFPLAYRSVGSGISSMVLAIMFFVMVKTAPQSFSFMGVQGTFCVYAICVVVTGSILLALLPETKGKTLYEIECHFRGIKENSGELNEKDKMMEMELIEGR